MSDERSFLRFVSQSVAVVQPSSALPQQGLITGQTPHEMVKEIGDENDASISPMPCSINHSPFGIVGQIASMGRTLRATSQTPQVL